MSGDCLNTPEASLFHCQERGGKPLEYVTVTTRMWKDRWVRGLTPDAKLLWVYLVTHDSDYGFYEYDPESWAMETGLDFMLIADLIIQFKEAGKIALSGDLLLVIKALQHRRLSTRDYDFAVNAIRRRYGLRAPALVSLCLERNPADSTGTHGTRPLSESEQNQNKSDQINCSAPASRPVEDAGWVQLAREVHWYICHQAAKHKIAHAGFKNDPQECGRELRLLVENDKVPLESILPSLAWAWGYEFADRQHPGTLVRYGSVLLSIKHWRPTKFKTMQEQWLRQTSGDTGQNERIRKAICDGMAKETGNAG